MIVHQFHGGVLVHHFRTGQFILVADKQVAVLDDDVDIRLQWGYAGGNYFYGHSTAESTDNFTPEVQDLYARYGKYKTVAKVDPKAKPTEDQREQLTLWAVPLIDNINAWTLNFVTGRKDINKDWNEYISSCKNLNIDKIVEMTNKIYKEQK